MGAAAKDCPRRKTDESILTELRFNLCGFSLCALCPLWLGFLKSFTTEGTKLRRGNATEIELPSRVYRFSLFKHFDKLGDFPCACFRLLHILNPKKNCIAVRAV